MDFKIVTDIAGLNQALFQVTHGLYILTSKKGDHVNGQCLDSLMQVTNVPPRIAIGIGKKSLTHEMIEASGLFIANVLDKLEPNWSDMIQLFGFRSGRNVDKFTPSVQYKLSESGIPILNEVVAYYECRVLPEHTVDLKTHTLWVGQVERAGTRGSGEPLTYNYYRTTRKKLVAK